MYQAGTLSANPVSMQAGLETLKILKKTNPYEELNKKTINLSNEIEKILSKKINVIVNQKSSIFWIAFFGKKDIHNIKNIKEIPSDQKKAFKKVFHLLLEERIYLPPSGFEVGFLSISHSDEIIEKTLYAFEKVIKRY